MDFVQAISLFSMSSNFGTAFCCHGDVLFFTTAVPSGLSLSWFLCVAGGYWIGCLLVMNEAKVHMDPNFGILISMAKCTRVYERPKSPTLVFATKRVQLWSFVYIT